MLVHSTPPLPPRLPPIHPRTFSSSSGTTQRHASSPGLQHPGIVNINHQNTSGTTHVQSPLGPPPFFRRTSSLRDPPPGGSRSPSIVESEQDQEEDEFMAHQTRSGRRKVSRRKDDKT
ncbi:uncharacterized protein L201_001856 [Kwoniella dendrophila CBS 6074]|uniref:Uncharacterized protein n=1 Tax=Kwoniella dendrophila CBS 6074 TaxID=1295534 RepID=A0AAX4JR22_9TREE